MPPLLLLPLVLLLLLPAASASPSLPPVLSADVLVYAANPGGIGAAIAAADGGKNTVVLMERLTMIGGMGAAGGVGLMNQGAGLDGVTGLGRVWGELNAAAYGRGGNGTINVFPDLYVAAASFWTMLNSTPGITTTLGCRLVSVARSSSPSSSACLQSADFLCDNDTTPVTVTASVFIDASYDGDIAVQAGGIDVANGREGSAEFNESLAGVQLLDDPNESFDKQNLTVDAAFPNGTLLKGITSDPLPPVGTADDRLMAFSYFPCASADPNNSVPWPQPPGYDPEDFTLLLRTIEAVYANGGQFDLSSFSEWQAYDAWNASSPKILLCCGRAPVNCDEPDLNRGYATANASRRLEIEAAHRYYLLGSFYFMANDLRVPNYTRYAIGRWGLCADEYVENDNFPPQIYVRISNRLRGMTLLTQNNLANPRGKPDGVSMGCWEFDQHTMSRHAVPDPKNASRLIAMNEGYMRHELTSPFRRCGTPGALCGTADTDWYDVPFGTIVPQRGQASNLLVPVALSATSIAYSSTRIEGMYMDLGTAAGVAAALALGQGRNAAAGAAAAPACPALAFQDTNVTAVQEILVNTYKQRIHGPVGAPLGGWGWGEGGA
jgi:hypothetical protein